eukprot:gene18692-20579_t
MLVGLEVTIESVMQRVNSRGLAMGPLQGHGGYSADLGSTPEHSGYHQVVIGENVADNRWHHVVVAQNKKAVTVMLDKEAKSMVSPGLFHRLDLDIVLYAGGINKVEQRKHQAWVPETRNFKGCLANVVFRARNILHSAKFNLVKTITHGDVPFQCISQVYAPMSFTTSNSKISFRRPGANAVDTMVSMKLRTFEGSGMIAAMSTTRGHVTLANVNGRTYLNVTFSKLIGPEQKVFVTTTAAGHQISDGDWHDVEMRVEKKKNAVTLIVDGDVKTYTFARHFELSRELGPFNEVVKIGGPSIRHPGFVGCVQNLTIDGQLVTLANLKPTQFNGITNKCLPKDLCFPNPCLNAGNCTQNHGEFTCKCQKSLFKGRICETSIFKRTCDEIMKSGKTRSGIYRISPNGIDSFDVYCKMDHELGAATIIHQTLNPNTLVVSAARQGMLYKHEMRYKLGKQSAIEVTDASMKCRQFIRYNCFQSKLLDSVRRYRSEHTRGGRWVSRNGIIQTYWGGATPGSKVCACGMPGKRACADHHLDCNCDMGDQHWRKDQGYLEDKDSLPVTSVQFSVDQQQGPTQRSFFTVGDLECFGTAPLPTTTPPPTTQTTTRLTTPVPTTTLTGTNASYIKSVRSNDVGNHLPTRFVDDFPTQITTVEANNSSLNNSFAASHVNEQDDIFPRPYLITIVVIGTVLCILLVTLVGILFKAKVSGLLFRKSCPPKPRVEIEEYDQRSSVISSDWEFRIGTSFPTSTPDESTTTSEEDMRVRTLEDIRGRRRYGRLGAWGSRTASAPTLGGRIRNSRVSINDRRSSSRHSGLFSRDGLSCNNRDDASSQPYETSSDSSKYTMKSTTNTSNSNSSRFSTCTEPGTASDCESVKNNMDDCQAEPAMAKNKRAERECDQQRVNLQQGTTNGTLLPEGKQALITSTSQKQVTDWKANANGSAPDSYMRVNGFSLPYPTSTGGNTPHDSQRQIYPQIQVNNYAQRPHIRRIPQPVNHSEYGTHLQLINPANRCYYPSQVNRFIPVGKRQFASDSIPFVQQTIQEVDVAEEEMDIETNLIDDDVTSSSRRVSNGTVHGNGFCHHDSLNSDYNEESRSGEGLALLRKKIIEKATSFDDEPEALNQV